ncbi:MAG TPA: NADH-ubiquinone oxidoreductase-F iron-sulfur binding region domain-containing protein [Armatimonadota bacterium]|jgi:NADH-quinone oxidoreductase subunit F
MVTSTQRLTSRDDLAEIQARVQAAAQGVKYRLLVCAGAGCVSSGCHAVHAALLQALDAAGLSEQVQVQQTGCIGTCDIGPTLVVQPDDVFYTRLRPEQMALIVTQHLLGGQVVEAYTYVDKRTGAHVPHLADNAYFTRQLRLVTAHCGSMAYDSIDAYIAAEGYRALAKALAELTPEQVIDEITQSGLRGRGGAGFPTGVKWQAGRRAPGAEKYVVCNADEGGPGAFMDRSLLEGDPHAIIEGMAICGYAIGARKGFLYVRAEYPLAVERMRAALAQARAYGLLGEQILGSDFAFDIEIRIGAGAFVCGEETALMASIAGQRGEPRQKPPFPFEQGVFGKPTIINNVETLANVPLILRHSAAWFTQFGTPGNSGTKVFALAGDVQNTGIVEVPMGMTLGEIIFDIGGGVKKGKAFKAAQTGGPSGGCLTREHLNTPVDFDALRSLGTIMGSGGLIVMDEDTCMVDMARFFLDFVQDESCGKCVPCRVGTKRMLEVLERITKGAGRAGDIELLVELAETCTETATCGLGQTAGNPVLSTIRHFRQEYEDHIKRHYCTAGVCGEMFISPCQNACPAGVNVPGYVALIAAGRPRDAYNLIRKENPFPAICGRVCTHPCEQKCHRTQLDEPLAISDLKRYAADYVFANEEPYLDMVFPRKAASVGVIGAGPSGLTCGYYLARLGYDVQVYEAQRVAGGVLAYGIPEYRLPKAILAREIRLIEQVGVTIHTGTEVGQEITFEDLRARHNAVYVATGTQMPNKVGVPGEELAGVYHGLDFLRDVHLGGQVTVGAQVAVIGGGSTAFDAARTALRLGAKQVTILYRRLIEDMPADAREIAEALEEGIDIKPLMYPVAFVGEAGRVVGVACRRMELRGFDRAGRRKPEPVDEEAVVIDADMVIPAISQHSDLPFIKKDEVEMTRWGTLTVNEETMMTSIRGVFAGGDIVRGPDVVIRAIADGKIAAAAIDRYLGGSGDLNTGEAIDIPAPADEPEVMEHERFAMRMLDPATRIKGFDEVVVGYHRLNAIAEAMRCLRCDKR